MKNYRTKHILTLVTIAVICIPSGTLIARGIKFIGFICIIWLAGNYEKKDELTRMNLGKANGIALASTTALLFLLGIVGDNTGSEIMRSDMYYYSACFAIGVRSIAFLILDRPEKEETED